MNDCLQLYDGIYLKSLCVLTKFKGANESQALAESLKQNTTVTKRYVAINYYL